MTSSFSQKHIDFIHNAFENKTSLNQKSENEKKQLLDVIESVILNLDHGHLRLCEKINGAWHTHQWLKKAILLSFALKKNKISGESDPFAWFDKVQLKTEGWSQQDFEKAAFRAVPGAIIRHGAFVEPGAILMPSFINIGARVGANTLIDTWVTIGSCAQIGANCHISGGVGIGGVLEPVQANPVIIEDNCFIGARSEIAEGVIVEEGAVVSMGVFIGASTKIVDRQTGEITYGRVPAYSVVVPGVLPAPASATTVTPHLFCAVIVKRVDEKTRAKTSINELLRETQN
jgi:2,3,4,5-tetrahydropyridine-2-carboxylate N-succinyltransferase